MSSTSKVRAMLCSLLLILGGLLAIPTSFTHLYWPEPLLSSSKVSPLAPLTRAHSGGSSKNTMSTSCLPHRPPSGLSRRKIKRTNLLKRLGNAEVSNNGEPYFWQAREASQASFECTKS